MTDTPKGIKIKIKENENVRPRSSRRQRNVGPEVERNDQITKRNNEFTSDLGKDVEEVPVDSRRKEPEADIEKTLQREDDCSENDHVDKSQPQLVTDLFKKWFDSKFESICPEDLEDLEKEVIRKIISRTDGVCISHKKAIENALSQDIKVMQSVQNDLTNDLQKEQSKHNEYVLAKAREIATLKNQLRNHQSRTSA